jgi:hypothetical protein
LARLGFSPATSESAVLSRAAASADRGRSKAVPATIPSTHKMAIVDLTFSLAVAFVMGVSPPFDG